MRAPHSIIPTSLPAAGVPAAMTPHSAWSVPVVVLLACLAVSIGGPRPAWIPALYVAFVTPGLCLSDITERRLPNDLVLPGYVAGAIGMLGTGLMTGSVPWFALACGVGALVVLGLLALAGGLGMGDAKLAGVLGIIVGLLGPTTALLALVLALVVGGVAALLAARAGERSLPFGPCLLAGFWAAIALSAVLR